MIHPSNYSQENRRMDAESDSLQRFMLLTPFTASAALMADARRHEKGENVAVRIILVRKAKGRIHFRLNRNSYNDLPTVSPISLQWGTGRSHRADVVGDIDWLLGGWTT
jgi:hypothetical protein